MTVDERAVKFAFSRWRITGFFDVGREAYNAGAADQTKLAKDWLRNNYGRFDGKVEDFISDFEKAITL